MERPINLLISILKNWYQTIPQFLLGLKKPQNLTIFNKKSKLKSSFSIFSKNVFRNELHAPFLPYFDNQPSICEKKSSHCLCLKTLIKNLKIFKIISTRVCKKRRFLISICAPSLCTKLWKCSNVILGTHESDMENYMRKVSLFLFVFKQQNT